MRYCSATDLAQVYHHPLVAEYEFNIQPAFRLPLGPNR